KSRGIWESRQAPYKRALQRHPEGKRWERFVAEAGLVDRIAKGRADGDAWQAHCSGPRQQAHGTRFGHGHQQALQCQP
ncbi:hypothetical protein ACTXP8_27615, partial [Klebsiella pneumoniae]|uniref:hypothetical protein n=1 Tax=Klebsiella pneumoniae TaxID=573 RepID=UPI003FD46FA2